MKHKKQKNNENFGLHKDNEIDTSTHTRSHTLVVDKRSQFFRCPVKSALNVTVAVYVDCTTRLPLGIIGILVVGCGVHGHVALLSWSTGGQGLPGG